MSDTTFPESRFESIFNHVNEGILIANARGQILDVNPRCRTMFGYEEREMIGMLVESLVPERLAERHVDYREAYMRHPTKRPMGKNLVLFGRKKDGSQFPIEISLSYYESEQGLFAIAFIIDITERHQQQEKINRIHSEMRLLNENLERKVGERTLVLKEALHDLEHSRDELETALQKEKELNEMKSRFISMASHEFRTPLSTILSSASLISKYDSMDDQEKRIKHINRIKNAVSGLTEILNDFLSLGKLEEGKVALQPVEFNSGEFVDELVIEMQFLVKSGQSIRFHSEGSPVVILDRTLLRNILINLISNAIKFSPENSPIEIALRQEGAFLEIEVRDHGMGIPEEDQKHLFDRFFRGKNVSNIQGTGLGLNIVLKYLELLNGFISFESKLEVGTVFYLRIPSSPTKTEDHEAPPTD
ncbi:MAG: ATP-binding protein [Flavobacteriales bacterium]